MKESLSLIDQKILNLKQKKEKLQTQQATLFLKEAQKIIGAEFSIELALGILSQSWSGSSDKQKEEWNKSSRMFCLSPKKSRKENIKIAATNS